LKNVKSKVEKFIIKILNILVITFWLLIVLVAIFLIINELIHLFHIYNQGFDKVIHTLLVIFIYIEIITMTKKYFEENYHFPKRYLIYIAITALARHIIGDMKHALFYSISLFILVLAFTIIVVANKKYNLKDWKKVIDDSITFLI